MRAMEQDFISELEGLINRYSKENGSGTPDFILAGYLNACLEVFNTATTQRTMWYGQADLTNLNMTTSPTPIQGAPDEAQPDKDIDE